jgi:hypothetical protein
MTEAALWQQLKRQLLPRDHAKRIENRLEDGTPDVNCCLDGVDTWIELKQLADWPRRATTGIRLSRYTAAQRAWLRARCDAGGNALLVLYVARPREWVLVWPRGTEYVDGATRAEVYGLAGAAYKGRPPAGALRRSLMGKAGKSVI